MLQQLALHQLFLTELPPEQAERYDRTLNIRWAMDIKNGVGAR